MWICVWFIYIVDSSGFRFHYTEDVRKYDAAVLVTGVDVPGDITIPPGQPSWDTIGYCNGACTKEVNNKNNKEKEKEKKTKI